MKLGVRCALGLAASLGCGPSRLESAPPIPRAASAQDRVELTILYTADEHGWIVPTVHEGVRRGGASQFLTQLVRDEEACTGALPPAPRPDCSASHTLLLSGG